MSRFLSLVALVLVCLGVAAWSHAAAIEYETLLSGLNEPSPNASPGIGDANVVYDDLAHTLRIHVDFSGLTGTTTASHIHGPTAVPFSGSAGVITTTPYFAGFPIGVTSGSYDNTLDLTLASSWNPSFVTAHGGTTAGAEAALAAAMAAGESYLNIHSSTFPGGEISGYLTAIPEPATLSLLALGGLALIRRRRT
jgi:hypothetical protein